MKKINISKLRAELEKISTSEAKKTIVINNAELYNDLITNYKQDKEQHNIYIIYQLNGMIVKQLNELEKLSGGAGDKGSDKLTTFMQSLKNKKIETRN